MSLITAIRAEAAIDRMDRGLEIPPRLLRSDLTPEERERAERIGSIEFKSAGAKRKS